MNRIHFSNVWARLEGPGLDTAWNLLSYRPKGYYFNRAYQDGYWDGHVRLLNHKTGMFPAGLVPYLTKNLTTPVTLVDERPDNDSGWHEPWYFNPKDKTLMAHQEAAIAAAFQHERGVIEHPVAAGKSITALALATHIGLPTLILVHRKDLLMQFYNEARASVKGATIGVIGNGAWQPGDITIATFQSLWSRLSGQSPGALKLLADVGTVIMDEVHHALAKTFEAVMKMTTNARYRIGFSATPFKSGEDDEAFFRVMSWFGPVIHQVTVGQGVEIGRSVPATIYFIRPTWPQPDLTHMSWQEEYQAGIVDNEPRNHAIIQLAQKLRQTITVLILCDRLDHGQKLADALGCPFLRGETELSERIRGWGGMKDGSINCLVASKIADEGVDIPGIEALILAGGGKAKHVMIQRLGRGQRAYKDKERLWAFDFEDSGLHLAKHAAGRLRLYREQDAYDLAETTLEELLS